MYDSKKTGTIRSSELLLQIVPFFLNQMLQSGLVSNLLYTVILVEKWPIRHRVE